MTISKPHIIDTAPNKILASDTLLRQFVGYRMKRAYLRIQDDMAQALAPFGLRTSTFAALAVVVASPGMSQADLGAILNIKPSGIVVLVDELERAGALKRKPVHGNRRANALTVTAAGRRLWEDVERAVQDHEARLLSDLSPEKIEQLHGLLSHISEGLTSNKEMKQ